MNAPIPINDPWFQKEVDPSRRIDVAICSHGRPALLEKAIMSVLAQTGRGASAAIIVIENGPPSAETDLLATRFNSHGRVLFMREKEPGLSRARNRALAVVRTPCIAFLDDDAMADHDWIDKLLEAFEAFPNAGIVGGRVRPTFAAPLPPWFSDDLLCYLSAVDWGEPLRKAQPNEWFVGANCAYDVASAREHGGFREDLGRRGDSLVLLSNEETDLQFRIIEAGRDAVWQPAAAVDHLVSESRLSQDWIRRRAAWQIISDFLSGSKDSRESAARHGAALQRFFSFSSRRRRLMSLFEAQATPKGFADQVKAVRAVTAMMLTGGDFTMTSRAPKLRRPPLRRLLHTLGAVREK